MKKGLNWVKKKYKWNSPAPPSPGGFRKKVLISKTYFCGYFLCSFRLPKGFESPYFTPKLRVKYFSPHCSRLLFLKVHGWPWNLHGYNFRFFAGWKGFKNTALLEISIVEFYISFSFRFFLGAVFFQQVEYIFLGSL